MIKTLLLYLKKKGSWLVPLAGCILFLLSLFVAYRIIPFRHYYDVVVTWKGDDPGQTRMFYSHKYFSEKYSIYSASSFPRKSYIFNYKRSVNTFRLDLDEQQKSGSQFIISNIQINNVHFSGKKLFDFIDKTNQCKLGLNGDDLIITAEKSETDGMVDDIYICFSPSRKYSRVDFGNLTFLLFNAFFLLFALVGTIAIWIVFSKNHMKILSFIFHKFYLKSFWYLFWLRNIRIAVVLLYIVLAYMVFSFLPHYYDVEITFAEEDPGEVALYYTPYDCFDSRCLTQTNNDKSKTKTFSFCHLQRIMRFRIDFNQNLPDGKIIILDKIRINGVELSHYDLWKCIGHTNQARRFMESDKICFMARKYDPNGRILPIANDVYILFFFPDIYQKTDFYGKYYFINILIFLLSILAVSISIKFVSCEKIDRCLNWLFVNILVRFHKEILLVLSVGLFVILRFIVYKSPFSDFIFFVCEDAQYGVFIGIAVLAAVLIHHKLLNSLPFIALAVLYGIWFADIYLKVDLNARLRFKESAGWFVYAHDMLPMIKKALTQDYSFWELLLLLSTAGVFISVSFEKKRNFRFLFFTIGIIVFTLLLSFAPAPKSIFDTSRKNVFAYNAMLGVYNDYSPAYVKSIRKFTPEYRAVQGLNLKRNVILLVVESLSSYQSRFFSGLSFDNLKAFDSTMNEASSFSKNYRCSSYNTVSNVFSLLTGFYPLLRPVGKLDYKNKNKYYTHALAKEFSREGYHTIFTVPVIPVDDLDTVSQRSGFDCLMYDKNPFYANCDRYVFNSVTDDVSFKYLVKLTEEQKKQKKPYLIVSQTMTMHSPYLDPVSRVYSYEATVRYFDRAFKVFLDELNSSGYFDRGGVLVVTGDHRAMVPIESEEQLKIGLWAIQKVPLVIYGKGLKHIDGKNVYTHADLHFSLQYLMLKQAWKNQFQKNMFEPSQNLQFSFALYQQCLNPSEVLLSTSVGDGRIILNGDKSMLDCKYLSPEQKKLIESYIIWLRAR